MAIAFKVYQEVAKKRSLFLEKLFPDDQETIMLGRRHRGNDVVMQDELREVSNDHAMIKFRAGKYYLSDLDSQNKTFLNGKQVLKNTEVELTSGSIITMANFTLEELEITLSAEAEESPQIEFLARKIGEELRAAFKLHLNDAAEIRKQVLQKIIKQNVEDGDQIDKQKLIEQIKKLFPDRGYEWNQMQIENTKLRKFASEQGLLSSSYKKLNRLATEIIDEEVTFQNASEINSFCNNLKYTINLLLNSFSDLEKGRQRILKDFIEIWNEQEYESPLLNKTANEIFKLLLNWQPASEVESEEGSLLEKSMQILIVHEVALLKAYQKATHQGSMELLDVLDPQILAYHIGQQELQLGPLKIPYKWFGPFVQWLAWKKYKQEHLRLKNEDAQSFEALFRPSFANKYKEVIKQANQASKNLDETRIFFRDHIKNIKKDS